MDRSGISRIVVAVLLVVGGVVLATDEKPAARAQSASTAPAKPPRSVDTIMGDLTQDAQSLDQAWVSPAVLTDEAKRKQVAPKAIPVLKRVVADMKELAATGDPQTIDSTQAQTPLTAVIALLGDKETQERLAKEAKGADGAKATEAQAALLFVR